MSSPFDTPCARTTLAVNDVCLIQRCSCGHIHLSVGPITMRLPPQAIAGLSDGLQSATRMLSEPAGLDPGTRPSELN